MAGSKLIFQPYGKRVGAPISKTVLEVARKIGVDINSICGGKGLCSKCRIIVRDGKERLSAPSEAEKSFLSEDDLKGGFRLACQTAVTDEGTIVIEVPPESQFAQQRLLSRGLEKTVEIAPAIMEVTLSLEKPSLLDLKSDVDRLVDAVASEIGVKPKVDYVALKKIPFTLRKVDWTLTVTLWRGQEIISVEPGSNSGLYGFAVDVGTTKLAGYLVDLKEGKIVATASMMNPQIVYGEDLISRINYVREDNKNLTRLHQEVVEGINQLIREACESSGVSMREICDTTLAGNTAMHHIALGIPPDYVALMPYPTVLQSPVDVKARDLGVRINQGAYVHALPNIAGFVGGDAVADILATAIYELDELSMLIDIGTNTEIVLGNKARLTACSCASGPAFEGAHIKYGMRAATGAIEHVWIEPETFEVGYKTIDNKRPHGLCGSAIVDVLAEMLKRRLIDHSGRLSTEFQTPRLRRAEKSAEFVLAWEDETSIKSDIVVTQGDIREVQLAKAAIYTGASILMKQMKVLPEEIRKIFLAGAFGNYVDPQNARMIGMYPDVPLERVQFVGNTAGSGARMALLSVDARKTAAKIAKCVEYVELGADPNFQDEFLKATYLPHRETKRFPNIAKILGKITKID
jgi:uncharacterized 2Fe-2S/4Fe-4S cluster protein (DUF4445 family)